MRLPAILAAALLAAHAVPGRADTVTDQIGQALKYYQEGDVAGAIAELEFAVQELKGKVGQQYLATFPEPPAGWTAEDGQAASGGNIPFLGGGTALSRTYRSADGSQSIEAQILTGSSFMQGLAQMFMNPQLMAAQPGAKRVRIGRENGVVTYDAKERSGQLMIDLGGKATVMLQGTGLAGPEPMVELASRWDLRKVKEIAGG